MPKKDEKKNIIEEIEKTGFPLELRVSKILKDNSYYIANNLYYIDKDEDKGREIDMRALKNYTFKKGEKEYFIRHCFLIECKKSVDKPWVIFTSPKTYYDRWLFLLSCRGTKKVIEWKKYDVPFKMGMIHPFSIEQRRGRSFFEPFKNNIGGVNIYKSLITSVKATIAMRNIKFGAESNSVCFYYPLIVFEGKLYESYLDNNNGIKIQEADSIMVSFFYESPKYQNVRFAVPIVTEKNLQNFCSHMDSVLQFFGNFFEEHTDLMKLR